MSKKYGDFFLDDVHIHRINRENFSIYLGGDPSFDDGSEIEPGVDFRMADRFELNLDVLSNIDRARPILVYLSSCGGNWEEGMQIFSAINNCTNPITVLAVKDARSMTSIIPLAADRFLIRPPAKYMFHRGTYGFESLDEEVETEDNQRRKANEIMLRIYVSRLKEKGKFSTYSELRIKNILKDTIKDNINVWLDADEAVSWGFADGLYIGDYENLRTTKINIERRKRNTAVLRKPVKIKVEIT